MIPDAYPPIQDGDFATPSLFNDRFLLAWQQVDALNADTIANSDAISALSGRSFDDRYSLLSHNHDASYLKLSGGTMPGGLSVMGGLVVGSTNLSPTFLLDAGVGRLSSGAHTIQDALGRGAVTRWARRFSVPSSSYIDLLQLGTRGSYRITVGGCDVSSGPRSMGFYEVMAVVSSDYMLLGAITKHLEVAGDGLNLQWAGVTGSYSTAGAVLRAKTQQTTSDYWIVNVEQMALGTGGTYDLTWLN